jgi:hypothetical protein
MHPSLVLLLLVACFLALWLVSRRAQSHQRRVQERIVDPRFGEWQWQGYGDGDWWQGFYASGGDAIEFRIGGNECPEPELVSQAHALANSLGSFQQRLEQFLREEARQRPAEAQTIARLRLASIALFPGRSEDEPDGYSGAFVILRGDVPEDPHSSAEDAWRCDIQDERFANLRAWA